LNQKIQILKKKLHKLLISYKIILKLKFRFKKF